MLDPQIALDLLARWDAQQELYIARREERFDVIIEAVRTQCGDSPVVIDLACGPGSLGQRIIKALPRTIVWSVDVDPLLQAIGGSTRDGRRWIEADLRKSDWYAFLKGEKVDAVVSTTALHWLAPPVLVRVYEELAQIIRSGGIFLDGDHRIFPSSSPKLGKLASTMTDKFVARNRGDAEEWKEWWQAVSTIPALEEAFRRRQEVFSNRDNEHAMTTDFHLASLLNAGFEEANTLWQLSTDWIVAAIR